MRQIISYDLRKPGRDYSSLYEALKSIGSTRCHCLQSVWVVRTSLSNTAVRDQILPHLDTNDGLLVMHDGLRLGLVGLDSQSVQWLRESA